MLKPALLSQRRSFPTFTVGQLSIIPLVNELNSRLTFTSCHILSTMRRSFVAFLVCWCLTNSVVAQRQRTRENRSTAITHVTVIDPKRASVKRDMSVIIRGGPVVAVPQSRFSEKERGVKTIDGRGKFLIPGLWDMHVHLGTDDFDKNQMLRLFITQGVTGIRIMSGEPQHHLWRKQIERGELLGPRMIIASRIIAGPASFASDAIKVKNSEEARAAVRMVAKEHPDFIKVHDGLSREAYFAIIDEAKKFRLTVAGHVPESITAAEASNAGQISIEHFTGLSEAETDTAKADALIPILKRNHTWLCPTLIMRRNYAVLDEHGLADDSRLRYVAASWKGSWLNMVRDANKTSPAEWSARRETVRREKLLVDRFQKAGVQILAGTDTSNPFVMPGFGLHDELAMLAESGLSVMEALRTATENPVEFLQQTKTFGSLKTGRIADMVLLDANPLENIHNTARISVVILRGRLFDRQALDTMLAEIEAAALKN